MSARIDVLRFGVTNTYLLRDRGAVLIDAGWPPRVPAVPRALLSLLGSPPRLDLVVLTHAHWDHVGGAGRLREATAAPVAVHRADAGWLREGTKAWPKGTTTWGRTCRTVLAPLMIPFIRVPASAPDVLIGDEGLDLAPYGIDARVVHTPGHSPGSVSVVLPSGEAFVGDLAMNGPPMCLRPRFGVFAHEPELVPASWRRLVEMGVQTVYPAHGRPFPAAALSA